MESAATSIPNCPRSECGRAFLVGVGTKWLQATHGGGRRSDTEEATNGLAPLPAAREFRLIYKPVVVGSKSGALMVGKTGF